MAGMDILASAFNGANAAFLADLYARWATDPASVDPSFADLFAAMNDEARAVLEDATGASWAPRPSFAGRRQRLAAAGARPVPGGAVAGPGPRRHHRLAARADADPLLPRARPSGSAARSARPADAAPHRGTRPAHPTASPTPTSTSRSSSTTCWAAKPRRCGRSCRSCARPIAARSASSSCTSRIPSRNPGSSARSKARPGAPRSTPAKSAPSCSS